ncbi:MAG TPA: 8-oxo-dGTP diphosphatase MutT [Steroidobacteraceae bacterium]
MGPNADRRSVLVVAGALFDGEGRVLIAQRPAGKTLAGRWEFPGGKVDVGESEHAALRRELREELGVEVIAARPFMRLAHAYADRDVELSLWIVERFAGEPRSLDAQALKWVSPAALAAEDILEADQPFITGLRELRSTP